MSRSKEARAAEAAGLTRFISAKHCKKCGSTEFGTSHMGCIACIMLKRSTAEGRAKHNSSSLKSVKKDRETLAGKQLAAEAALRWSRNNPGKANARSARYNAAKLQRTPPWAVLELIELIYAECPTGYEVDHVVPLRGRNVSGLHVHYNLQYLPEQLNKIKSNKFSA